VRVNTPEVLQTMRKWPSFSILCHVFVSIRAAFVTQYNSVHYPAGLLQRLTGAVTET